MPTTPRPRRIHLALVAVAAIALTLLAHTLAEGDGPGADTIAWAPGAVNGLGADDWPIALLWVAGLALAVLLARSTTSRPRTVGLTTGIGALLTFFALTLLKGDGPDSGPTFISFSPAYGVNTGDVPVLVVWAVGITACVALLWRIRRTHRSDLR